MTSDIFSFYKEELVGETANFIHDRAIAEGTSTAQALDVTIEETVQAAQNIRCALKDNKERAVWEGFMTNYVAFHYYTARYKLRELTESAYVNPELEQAADCGDRDGL